MTPEAQRIAIAQACGWKLWNTVWTEMGGDHVQGWTPKMLEENKAARVIPNYPTDLNAMHEAEKVIPDDKIDEYKHRLCVVTTTKERITQCATAAQRAEAFLRTLNLWKP